VDFIRTPPGLGEESLSSPDEVLMKSLSTPFLIQVESMLSPHGRFPDEIPSGLH